VHQCLRFHRQFISERCREEEMKLQAVEYKDIRLRPKLAKVCSEERAVFCRVRRQGGGGGRRGGGGGEGGGFGARKQRVGWWGRK
jgi:hypothetical protein